MSPPKTNQNAAPVEGFSSVPVLDYTLIQNGQKAQFISELRHVLVNVGFLYLANPPIDEVHCCSFSIIRHCVLTTSYVMHPSPICWRTFFPTPICISQELTAKVSAFAPKLFDLPQSTKDKLAMRHNEHFYGYNRLGSELTKGAKDLREQFDFGTDYESDWAPGKPDYLRLWGNAQVLSYTLQYPMSSESQIAQ